MTIAPETKDMGLVRPCFKALKQLLGRINEQRIVGRELRILSMGMTNDFEAAIEEGSTMVRVGRAVFGS
jgi:uncharacterized pyridoxal phosphate-containing UPF0001 family protein